MHLLDDFEGERPEVSDVSTEELLRIYSETVEAIADPRDLVPKRLWLEQLDMIQEELEIRDAWSGTTTT